MSGFMMLSGITPEENTFTSEVSPTTYSRSRSNTIHGTMHSALRGAEPPVRFQQRYDPQDDDKNPGTARSPKLFLDCVSIRRRSQSLSYGSTRPTNLLKPRGLVTRDDASNSSSDNTSPENMISSTFPPRAELIPKKSVQQAPHPMTHIFTNSNHYQSSDKDMDTEDDAMETDDSFDEDMIHFEVTRKKKHVTWPEDNKLVVLYTYKSDKRYYEKNPFYGYGKIEYNPDDDEYPAYDTPYAE